MQSKKPTVYPYIPNSVAEIKKRMLEMVNAKNIDEFYDDIPTNLRLNGLMDLPPPLLSEFALKKHVQGILRQNISTEEYISFLGAGCYHHHVPAICDEINTRGEFLTAYAGEPYDDHGRFQALFEYTSMMGELLEMDVVNVPTYDGYQAAATALRMAARHTDRNEFIIPQTIHPGKMFKIKDYCQPGFVIKTVGFNPTTGLIDLDELRHKISLQTAAVYFDNPSYLGFIESQGRLISNIAHKSGAMCIVGVEPLSLGALTPPVNYGADIVCGDIQSLGIHMQYGGGHAGFIATKDDAEIVMEYPSRLFGIAPTAVPGEYGFGDVAYDRTSFAVREKGKEWVGTAAALWGITAGVYLALMGPEGMTEIGEGIMKRAKYAMQELNKIEGVEAPYFQSHHFQEFVVRFYDTDKTVTEINDVLLERKIFGGKDIIREFPELHNCALYCVSEIHSKEMIDRLVNELEEVIRL